MKRILSTILALVLLLSASAFAADVTLPISADGVTITVAGPNTGTLDWNDTIQVAEFEKRLGIKLECQTFENDVWQQQLTLMIASEELPDIVINPSMTLSEVAKYGAQGYFLDMKDLIDQHAPNIMEAAEKYPTYMNYCTSPDGAVYTLCTINPNLYAQVSRCFINRIWLENLNLEYPTTIDAFTDVLRAFKAQDANGNGDANDEIPLSNISQGYRLMANLMTAFGIYSYDSSNFYLLQADENGKVYLADTTENYKAFLTWMNQLWNEGLIDVNTYVQETSEFRAKVAADTIGAFTDAAPFVATGKDISSDADFYWLGGLTSEWNDTPTMVKSSSVVSSPKFLVNAETKYAEEIVKFFDYLFTDEGSLAGSRGYAGSSFEYVQCDIPGLESYNTINTDGYGYWENSGFTSAEEFRYKKALCNEAFNVVKQFAGTYYPIILAATTQEQMDALRPIQGWAVLVDEQGFDRCQLVDSFPGLLYDAEVADEHTQLYNDIKLYLESMQAQFITGQVDIETEWDNYLAQLETMGLTRLLEIEQAAYDSLMGA